jgi:hypothetical protein
VEDVPAGIRDAAPIRHFPKGTWLAEAALGRVAGSFEAGKAFTLLPDVSNYALLTCLAAYVLILRDRRDAVVLSGLVLTIACAANTKFTGLVFAALIGAGGTAWHALRGRPWTGPAAAVAAGLVVGAGVLGYAPYVRNALEHGHPFHPLSARSGAIPRYTPPNLQESTRVEKLLLSAFSETDARPLEPARPKLPVVVRQREVRSSASYDTRLGGFGPLFGLELALLGALLAHALAARRPAEGDLLALAGLLLVTCALFPEPWWARWIPQLWTVPLLAALAFAAGGRTGRALEMGLIALAAVNVGLAAGANGGRVAVRHREIAGAQRAAKAMTPPVEVETSFPEVVQARLAGAGVPSRIVPKVGCAEPLVVFPSHARICPAPVRPG